MLLQDQTVIVTGASRGIGKAIAVLLAREGATVVVNYAHSIERAENVVREIISAGGKAIAIKADVTLPEEVAAMIQSAVRQFGTIHGLVNNAGVPIAYKHFSEMRWDEFQRHFEVQLHGAFNMIQAVLPFMRERKSGSIVNIASETTLGMPPAGMCDYVSAKYSVVGLTLALAVELGKQGIRVNAVSPGFIDTELTARLPRIYKELVMAKSATGKPTSVDDVANEVLFLLSENSSPLTGENRCVGSITRT